MSHSPAASVNKASEGRRLSPAIQAFLDGLAELIAEAIQDEAQEEHSTNVENVPALLIPAEEPKC